MYRRVLLILIIRKNGLNKSENKIVFFHLTKNKIIIIIIEFGLFYKTSFEPSVNNIMFLLIQQLSTGKCYNVYSQLFNNIDRYL